jgi:hypothetical protein
MEGRFPPWIGHELGGGVRSNMQSAINPVIHEQLFVSQI